MQRVPANIALLHHTGAGNLGDQASVDAVLANIRQRWPDSVFALLSMNPGETAKIHGIPSYPLRTYIWEAGYGAAAAKGNSAGKQGFVHWLGTTRVIVVRLPRAICRELAFLGNALQVVKQFDLLVVSGGGQLNGDRGSWGFPYSLLSWCLLAKFAGARCFLLNIGAGPLSHSLSRIFANRTLHAADYVSFRDRPSQVLARKIGYAGKSQVFPDNVYSLAVSSQIAGHWRKRDHPIVGIAPLVYPHRSSFCTAGQRSIYDHVIANFAVFAASLAGHSYSLALFGTDIGEDPTAIEDLRKVLRDRHNVATLPYEPVERVDELLRRMSAMDYVVTCRFHGIVFAHLLNKPVLAISPHPKVADHMSSLGLSKYCVDIRAFDASLLADRFEALVRERDEIKSRMAASLVSRRSRLKAQFDKLFPAHRKQAERRAGAAGRP